jgi:hypothetical protein
MANYADGIPMNAYNIIMKKAVRNNTGRLFLYGFRLLFLLLKPAFSV